MAMQETSLRELLADYAANPKAKDDRENAGWDDEAWPEINDLIKGEGVAVIPIHGLMIKRNRWWCCGSDHWVSVIEQMTLRMDIEHIVLDIDSGGGQVAGTEMLADAVWKAREAGKNVIACVNEFAASAALWVASQAERIVIPKTGSIGSLGVYTLHFDDTKFLSENFGIDKSVVYRGKYKAIDERPLDKEARADLQRFVDAKYSLFVDAVARGRGISSEEVIDRWGDSRLFSGSEAVSNGLADEFGTLQDVLESLKAGRRGQVSVELTPAVPQEGDEHAMKLNAQGQILDSAGKVVGHLSDLGLTASVLGTHCKQTVDEMIASAVKTANDANAETLKAELAGSRKADQERLQALVAAVGADDGVKAFVAGHSIEQAKAAKADTLAAENEALRKQLAEAQQKPGGPGFASSEKNGGHKPTAEIAEKDAPFAADWNANAENCQQHFPDLKTYAAYRRHAVR